MKHLILTLSLLLGLATSSVSADNHLPTAGKILQEGKVIHKEVHLKRDYHYLNEKPDMLLNEYKTDVGLMLYHVMYRYDYYTCWVRGEEKTSTLNYVSCTKLNEGETYEYKSED